MGVAGNNSIEGGSDHLVVADGKTGFDRSDASALLAWPGFKASAAPRHSETLYTRIVVPAVHRNSLPIVDDSWISWWVLGSQISK